uniref:Coiled-coil domain-containing protein 186 n=1 Tax=Ascaris suum TaxID=6253 RepID=F1KUB2_ASCSU
MMAEEDNPASNLSCASDTVSQSESPVQNDDSCKLSEAGNLSQISALYEKYKAQCTEVERLEKQNSEYREQLLKTIRERESAEESLRIYRSEKVSKFDELERKLLEYEYQLKACKDRSAAQEAHHAKIIGDVTAKMNGTIAQLSKKCDIAEREKNDAVVRYATREAELMHLKSNLEKLEAEKASLITEKDALIESTKYQHLQDYKQAVEVARKELESEKLLRAQDEETLTITTKRLEAVQTVVTELRSMLEQSQKQLAKESEEKLALKSEHEKLLHQIDNDGKNRETVESVYKKVSDELSRLREENESMKVELAMVVGECREVKDQLSIEKERHKNALNELCSLKDIKSQIDSSVRRVEEAEREVREAIEDRDQAELEASECRKQTERMLTITEQLTDKNSLLSSECDSLRAKNLAAATRLIEVEGELRRSKDRADETQKELEYVKVTTNAEISSLREELNSKIAKVQELSRFLDEARNEKEVLKKKNASNIKELRAELISLRKAQAHLVHDTGREGNESTSFLPIANGGSSSSRASSICSIDTGGRALANPPSPVEDASHMQQQMVEKIVKLQRQLARKQDKVEFLEEHVRQCTEELRKKTKIIQNYALREEASLLLPESDSLSQLFAMCEVVEVPLARRKSGTTLMGSIFGNAVGKSEVDLATEVNSRLQAVLEDTLYKNITLKNNVDTLGEEISRLSRENRQLALSKAT